MTEWQPIGTAPLNKRVLLWWRPRSDPKYPHPPEAASALSDNNYAECCVVGEISGYEKGMWWNGDRYQSAWHVTHWMPLPEPPK